MAKGTRRSESERQSLRAIRCNCPSEQLRRTRRSKAATPKQNIQAAANVTPLTIIEWEIGENAEADKTDAKNSCCEENFIAPLIVGIAREFT
jgi:hypothetical protein